MRPLRLKWSIDMWKSCEPVLSSTPIVILPFSVRMWKCGAPWGKGTILYLRSLVFTAVPLLTLFSNYAAFPVISLHSQWVMDSSLFKVKNNPLYIFISSPHYFFYSTWLALIDIFHLHGIHFLLTLWKMRKVTSTKELGHKDQLRESDRLCCCIIWAWLILNWLHWSWTTKTLLKKGIFSRKIRLKFLPTFLLHLFFNSLPKRGIIPYLYAGTP